MQWGYPRCPQQRSPLAELRLEINGYILKPISRNTLEERITAASALSPVKPIT